MEIDNNQKAFIAESLLDASEDYLQMAKTGNTRMIKVSRLNSQELATIQNLCGTVGDVANLATTVVSMVRDMKKISTEATIILSQLDGRVKITLEKIKVISGSLDVMQKIILSIPEDYNNKELMERKSNIINRMTELTFKLADLV